MAVLGGKAQNLSSSNTSSLVPGVYKADKHGQLYAVTNVNVEALWPGAWVENTNGVRVQLSFTTAKGDALAHIGVGSVKSNALGGYVKAAGYMFLKFELQDTNGVELPLKDNTTVVKSVPTLLSVRDFPRDPNGRLESVSYFTNGGPTTLAVVDLKSIYRIPREHDYVLTVCPVIYKFGSNVGYLERVDLPCVSSKVHLK